MKKLIPIFFAAMCLCSCNMVTVQVIKTEGTATDLIDDSQDMSPTVSPTIRIPSAPLLMA